MPCGPRNLKTLNGWASGGRLLISPLVGEMPGRAEGGRLAPPLTLVDRQSRKLEHGAKFRISAVAERLVQAFTSKSGLFCNSGHAERTRQRAERPANLDGINLFQRDSHVIGARFGCIEIVGRIES